MSDEKAINLSLKSSTAYDAPLFTIRADNPDQLAGMIRSISPAVYEDNPALPVAIARLSAVFKDANDAVFPTNTPAAAAPAAQTTPAAPTESAPAAQNPWGGTSTPAANSAAPAQTPAAGNQPWQNRPATAAAPAGGSKYPPKYNVAFFAGRTPPQGEVSGLPKEPRSGIAQSGRNAGSEWHRWQDPRPWNSIKDLPDNMRDVTEYIND